MNRQIKHNNYHYHQTFTILEQLLRQTTNVVPKLSLKGQSVPSPVNNYPQSKSQMFEPLARDID